MANGSVQSTEIAACGEIQIQPGAETAPSTPTLASTLLPDSGPISELAQWKQHAANLEAKVGGLENTIGHLAQRNGRLAHEVSVHLQRGKDLEAAETQLELILRSGSWRITRPLRASVRLVSRLRSLLAARARRILSRAGEHDPAFDRAYYIARYQDVAGADLDPYQHFLKHGRPEGRHGRPAPVKITKNKSRIDSSRPYVLVVSHEASRTGAPILALNICQQLQKDNNVIALLLGPGELIANFQAASSVLVGPYQSGQIDPLSAAPIIKAICDQFAPSSAIVNSLASRVVLEPIAKNGLPSVLLVHEFYKFHCSDKELVDTFMWAGEVVFAGAIIRESASIEKTRLAALAARIVPQGKCEIPSNQIAAQSDPTLRRLQHMIAQRPTPPFVVIGAGVVEYRKGVDLFVATASAIRQIDPQANILMAWVGKVVPLHRQYAEFVQEQVIQAGTQDGFVLLDETSNLEEVYRIANACFISSRLDPLPNIAIDAMTAGVPVLCFDGASAVAEILREDIATRDCVLPFLDFQAVAKQLIRLAADAKGTSELSEVVRLRSASLFDMEQYATRLVALVTEDRGSVAQLKTDIERLMNLQDFALEYYNEPGVAQLRRDAVEEFARASQRRIFERKPSPGFYGNIYVEQVPSLGRAENPFLHFLDRDRPAGPWQVPTLNLADATVLDFNHLRTAVHVHVFYPELLNEILSRLRDGGLQYDLYASVPSHEIGRQVVELVGSSFSGQVVVRTVPNRGRDIGPLLTEFREDLLQYDVVGHFHTKKSTHVVAGSRLVEDWINFLYESLLGGKHKAIQRILGEFARNPRLGLVFADDPNMIGWDKNEAIARKIADRIGIEALPSMAFPFPVGTMFWSRPAALGPLFNLKYSWNDYPEEPVPIDGTMLHAIERLIAIAASHAGYEINTTYAPGLSR